MTKFGIGLVSLACCLFLLTGCDSQTTRYRIWHYSDAGKTIQSWENVSQVDPIWNNDRVTFKDEKGKEQAVFGTVVIATDYHRQQGTGPATHTITLYSPDGTVIRTWGAVSVDANWANNLVRFTDVETGFQFDVISSRIHVKQN